MSSLKSAFSRFIPAIATITSLSLGTAGSFDTTITVSALKDTAIVPPGIYGQYLEHVQAEEQTIYPALWDSQSPHADNWGLRKDVISASRKLEVPVVRWPGGCFADVYHWEDAIGPQSNREAKPNRHWGGMESNQFGTDEFLRWCELSGSEPYINVNLGSGSIEEALRWLEYCNGSSTSTVQGKRRAENGHPEPYGVRYWGIGNETWGPWETGHTDAETYGTSLSLWARAMRTQDPSIRILGVGSEEGNDRAWDEAVLAAAGTDIDLLTVHMYGVSTTYDRSEYEAFVFTPVYLENRLRRMLQTLDSNTGTGKESTVTLSIDEWNIRHHFEGKQNRKSPRNLQDALFAASFFNSMIRLSPRIEMANYVFLVNGNGTLLVNDNEVLWTPLAYIFQQYNRWMKGTLRWSINVQGPVTIPPAPITGTPGRKVPADYKSQPVSWIDAVAVHNEQQNSVAISLVNRHPTDSSQVTLQLPEGYGISETWTLTHDDIYGKNTFEHPRAVQPVTTRENQKRRDWKVAPHSVSLLLCTRAN